MIIQKQRASLLFLLITSTLISIALSLLQNSNFNITERKILVNLEDKSNENIFNSSLFLKGLNNTDLRLTFSNYNNKNNYKQIVYSTSYPDNNVTGTGNMLEDAIYRAKCKILDCSNCCSGEINSMYCENANTCQIYFDHQSFTRLLPLIIILSIYGFIFVCLIMYGCATKENAWEGMKFALLGIFYCIVFPFIGFFYAIAMILCCDMKTKNNSNSVENKKVVNYNSNNDANIKNNVQKEDIDKKSENNSILIINNNMNNGEGGINIKQREKNNENSDKNDELNKQQTILPPGGSEAIDGGSNLTNNNPGVIINKPTEKDSVDDKNFNNNFS